MDFTQIKKINFPRICIDKAYSHLRLAGKQQLEGVVLLAGKLERDQEFTIHETIIPRQTSLLLEDGLLYAVDGEELYRINVYLHQHGMVLISQLHSHPGRAYHSSTDDSYAIITKIGGLSIVVPNFGFDDFLLPDWAVFRLNEYCQWEELNEKEVRGLISVV